MNFDNEVLKTGNRASFEDEDDGFGYQGANGQQSQGSDHNAMGNDSGADAFGFGSVVERKFLGGGGGAKVGGTGSAAKIDDDIFGGGSSKQMFEQVEINVWIPKDPTMLNVAGGFKVQDTIEDEPEKLEKCQYHVSKFKCTPFTANKHHLIVVILSSFLIHFIWSSNLKYIQCEVMGHYTVEAVLMKSIDHFNT